MSTLAMSFSARFYCSCKTKKAQLLGNEGHVVVEISTYDYRGIGILSYDISDNLSDSYSSFFQVLLVSWLEIAVKYLDKLVAELQLCPTQISPKCLHQL
jgi:hypothetical protein